MNEYSGHPTARDHDDKQEDQLERDIRQREYVREVEEPILHARTWKELIGIASVLAVLLGAHYLLTQATMKNTLNEYEKRILVSQAISDAHSASDDAKFEQLYRADKEAAATLAILQARQEGLERELAIIKERQEQVRAKIGITR